MTKDVVILMNEGLERPGEVCAACGDKLTVAMGPYMGRRDGSPICDRCAQLLQPELWSMLARWAR